VDAQRRWRRERATRDAGRHPTVGLRRSEFTGACIATRESRWTVLALEASDRGLEELKRSGEENQANKSIGRMPRHQAPKKDVASCEKLRGAASGQRTVDIRMGKPGGQKVRHAEMNT
jgi:hypothetical protein